MENSELLLLCRALCKLDKKTLEVIVNSLDTKVIHKLGELYHNVEFSIDKIPKIHRDHLKKCMSNDKSACRYISNKRKPVHGKRKFLKKQVGSGIFTLILSTAIPLLISLLSKK